MSYGSPGVGTVGHIGMELLKTKTNINPLHVPYPGYPQVASAMIAGELQLSMLPPALASAQIKAGKLRAIGVTSSGRSPLVPELPSLAEAGVQNFNLESGMQLRPPSRCPSPSWPSCRPRSAKSPVRPKCAPSYSSKAGRWWAPRLKELAQPHQE